MIAHKDVLAHTRDVLAERTIWLASDNRAAVAWSTKGSATSVTARASLLRFNALHQRTYRYVARNHYIPGPVNVMADDASRRWDLSEEQLLSHFNTHYPQALSWQIRTLPSATNATLTGALSRKRAIPGSHINAMPPPPQHGSCGRPSVPASASTPIPWRPVTQSLFSNSSPTGIVPALSAPGRRPVRTRTVEDALRAVGQTYAGMGTADPRMNRHGEVDFRITSLPPSSVAQGR